MPKWFELDDTELYRRLDQVVVLPNSPEKTIRYPPRSMI